MEKISRLSFRDAQRCERIADLCWELSDILQEYYVGYEDEISRFRNLAIEFEKQFDAICPGMYEC